jgi:soluble lytic murein transglycosylase-like protein
MTRRQILAALAALALTACSRPERPAARAETSGRAGLDAAIARHAAMNGVPESLVHRDVRRESNYNPAARNGPYWGLMQMLPQTARTMGFRGQPEDLLDAETNLTYGVRYLRGAWLVSDGSEDRAVMWYARGYYHEAKRRGLLHETGLRG